MLGQQHSPCQPKAARDLSDAAHMLLPNLRALNAVDPALAKRLIAPVNGDHVVEGPKGPSLKLHREPISLVVDPDLPAGLPKQVDVYGVGLGEQVLAALKAGHTVRAWDRDPLMLRLLLAGFDLREPLSQGRLTLLLGADLWGKTDFQDHLEHPVLSQVYTFERVRQGKPVLIVPDGLFVGDLAQGLRERGFVPWPILARTVSQGESQHTIDATGAELVVSVGYIPGLPEVLAQQGVRHLIWEVDPTLDTVSKAEGPVESTRVFTYRKAHVEAYQNAGFQVAFRPLCANPESRRPLSLTPEEQAQFGAPVAFVGASMQETAQRYRRIVHALLSKAGRPVEELEHRLAEQAAHPERFMLLDLAEDAALQVPDLDVRVLVGEIAAAEQRMHFLKTLLPLGLKVWGDAGWSELGTAYQGPAGHQHALTRIYNAAQVNVDIGRIYQKDILTMRVFDVLACGGFLVTQDSPELRSLFTPDEHLLAVNTPKEMHDAVAWALAHPEDARRIAQAGQAHVLAHHTLSHRLDDMLAPATWETQCTPFSSAAPAALAQL